MVAHMISLHISHDYTSHNSPDDPSLDVDPQQQQQQQQTYNPNHHQTSYNNLLLSKFNLEQKLRNARNIKICEEVRKLHNPDAIIPKALLNHMEKPCTALVIWQPQKSLEDFVAGPTPPPNNSNSPTPLNSHRIEFEDDYDDCDNNNSSSVDLNSFMDLDV